MPTGTLSGSGKKLFESTYKDYKDKGASPEVAAKEAWGAVKRAGWRKINGKWVKKSEMIETFSMYVTKATLDGKIMRWQATNSDTAPDSHEERMSMELYQNFIDNIANKVDVPEIFRSAVYSDFWKGGMPYLSISHYPDLGGKAVPGQVVKLYVDGNKLKAKGNLYNTPLGHAVYRSLKSDENKSPQDKIRISIGFLDLAHKHGNGKVWVRESLYSVCPACSAGVGDKVYIKGYLVHLALTRVPVNKRTEMVLEEKSDMTKKVTRKEDAASIVGKDEAEVIDALNKASAVVKSDTLVEMSEGEEPTTEETQELVAEAEKPAEPVTDNGAVADDEGLTENEETTEEEVVLESQTDKSMDSPTANMPYGGATSMKDAKKHKDQMKEMVDVMDMFAMFTNVVWNVIESGAENPKEAIKGCVDELKSMLAAKAMVEFSENKPVSPNVEKAENNENSNHPLKPALDALVSAVDNSIVLEGDINAKLESVNPALQELGTAITDFVQKSAVAKSEPAAPQNVDNKNLLEDIKALIQPLSDGLALVKSEVGVIKAQVNAKSVQPQAPRIPTSKTVRIAPNLTQKSQTEQKSPTPKLHDIINKSVGLVE